MPLLLLVGKLFADPGFFEIRLQSFAAAEHNTRAKPGAENTHRDSQQHLQVMDSLDSLEICHTLLLQLCQLGHCKLEVLICCEEHLGIC